MPPHVDPCQMLPNLPSSTQALFYLVTDSNLTKWHQTWKYIGSRSVQLNSSMWDCTHWHLLNIIETNYWMWAYFTQCISAVATVMNQTTNILGSPEYIDKFVVFMKRGILSSYLFFIASSNLVGWASLGLPAQDMLCMYEWIPLQLLTH